MNTQEIDAIYNYHTPNGIQCTVQIPPNADGTYRVYVQSFGSDRGRDDILQNEIMTGAYLNWPFQDLAPEPPADSPPDSSPDAP